MFPESGRFDGVHAGEASRGRYGRSDASWHILIVISIQNALQMQASD
jgi:hypothetical protein